MTRTLSPCRAAIPVEVVLQEICNVQSSESVNHRLGQVFIGATSPLTERKLRSRRLNGVRELSGGAISERLVAGAD